MACWYTYNGKSYSPDELKAVLRDRADPNQLKKYIPGLDSAVPNMPLGDTKDWAALAMKRVIRHAADHGYKGITWTTGSQQEDRYWGNELVDPAVKRWSEITKPESVGEKLLHHFGSELASVTPLEVVDAPMLSGLKNDKIRGAVIKSIPVDVMNMLSAHGVDPDELLRKPDVNGKRIPVDVRPAIARGLAGSLQLTGARLRAALNGVLSPKSTLRDEEVLPAVRASDIDTSISGRLLSQLGPTNLLPKVDTASDVDSAALNRAPKSPVSGGVDLAGVSPKLRTAELAEALNRHAQIIADRTGNPITDYAVQPPPGEGMREFYDKILPSVANKIGKPHGAQHSMTTLTRPAGGHKIVRIGNTHFIHDENDKPLDHGSKADMQAKLDKMNAPLPVHYLPITPSMKNYAHKMFKRGGSVTPNVAPAIALVNSVLNRKGGSHVR